jgi:hypothetical protein
MAAKYDFPEVTAFGAIRVDTSVGRHELVSFEGGLTLAQEFPM